MKRRSLGEGRGSLGAAAASSAVDGLGERAVDVAGVDMDLTLSNKSLFTLGDGDLRDGGARMADTSSTRITRNIARK